MVFKMKNKPYVVMTSSDSKYGDFLINHWLRSLKGNIDRNLVDIVVFNYGLTNEQKNSLISKNIIVVDCVRDGLVNNIRFRDMLNFLNKHRYKQVMSCDGGDIIFQDDIMELFTINKSDIKAVLEESFIQFHEYLLACDALGKHNAFSKEFKQEILSALKNKKAINCGMIVSPSKKFKELCSKIVFHTKNNDFWGPDTVITNYFLYKEGFHELGVQYNFIISTAKTKFKIKNGIFLDKNNDPLHIIHNTGGNEFNRPVKNFGYGEDYNQIRLHYYFLKALFKFGFIANLFYKIIIKMKKENEK